MKAISSLGVFLMSCLIFCCGVTVNLNNVSFCLPQLQTTKQNSYYRELHSPMIAKIQFGEDESVKISVECSVHICSCPWIDSLELSGRILGPRHEVYRQFDVPF